MKLYIQRSLLIREGFKDCSSEKQILVDENISLIDVFSLYWVGLFTFSRVEVKLPVEVTIRGGVAFSSVGFEPTFTPSHCSPHTLNYLK